ncbi:olfactory receptor 10V1-like [Leptonychotes weddellii]|uniref:Olfactory receptor 10V1-like n=1 Tax=Leptonychotes weddellii TaxID=9713 RepID=A0A2U3Y6U0_LEPWE|nr:olfactory receptor 10V1-like [Leptonychotes weddellii]
MALLQKNHTLSSEFIILGFGDLAELQIFFFGLFLIMYLVTLTGHTTIVLITLIDSCLQTPMYFFLRNLSTTEICYILVIVPNMLANFLCRSQRMPFLGCALQMHLFIALGGVGCFLLAVMAYDRFVAICNPLRYTVIITRALCLQMLTLACISGFALSLTLTMLIFLLPFCQSHEINHFFCDIPAVLFLACSDTRAKEIAVFLVCMVILLIPFLLILLSYAFIIAAILRMHSAEGRSKAFSTCAGHLLVSVLHDGCAIFIYIRPKSRYTPEQDKIVSLIYTNVTPMLYPMIYSLRNKEVKGALRRLLVTALTVLLIMLGDDPIFYHKEALTAIRGGTPQWERQILEGRNNMDHFSSTQPYLLFGQCDCKSLREYGDNREESTKVSAQEHVDQQIPADSPKLMMLC